MGEGEGQGGSGLMDCNIHMYVFIGCVQLGFCLILMQ